MKENRSQHVEGLHELKFPSLGGVRGGSGPKGSRGDPPIESGSRGHPYWIYDLWGDSLERNDDENSVIPIRCLQATAKPARW